MAWLIEARIEPKDSMLISSSTFHKFPTWMTTPIGLTVLVRQAFALAARTGSRNKCLSWSSRMYDVPTRLRLCQLRDSGTSGAAPGTKQVHTSASPTPRQCDGLDIVQLLSNLRSIEGKERMASKRGKELASKDSKKTKIYLQNQVTCRGQPFPYVGEIHFIKFPSVM